MLIKDYQMLVLVCDRIFTS